jgi:hypothetical protein
MWAESGPDYLLSQSSPYRHPRPLCIRGSAATCSCSTWALFRTRRRVITWCGTELRIWRWTASSERSRSLARPLKRSCQRTSDFKVQADSAHTQRAVRCFPHDTCVGKKDLTCQRVCPRISHGQGVRHGGHVSYSTFPMFIPFRVIRLFVALRFVVFVL